MKPYVRLFEAIHNIHVRNEKAWKKFRALFPDTPEYPVLAIYEAEYDNPEKSKQILNSQGNSAVEVLTDASDNQWVAQEMVDLLNGKWVRKVISVTLADFSLYTQKIILDRDFGHKNPYDVPRDKERLEYQLKTLKADGTNEPIIVAESSTGYDLYEGFHRTMALLQLGDGLPVKINAWVRLAD